MAGRLGGWGALPNPAKRGVCRGEDSGWGSRGDDHVDNGGEVEGRGGERTNKKERARCGKAKLEVS